MTQDQKSRIKDMRKAGYSYSQIAAELSMNENTIKTFCRRNGLMGIASKTSIEIPAQSCRQCGALILQYPGRKEKKFCSDACRLHWWKAHQGDIQHKTMIAYTCPTCGKSFSAYHCRNRKYCCHACYITDRFGGAL